MPKTKSISGIAVILLIFVLLGLYYSYYTPLWNPPDEERHFAYCEYIAQNHTLPEYRSDVAEGTTFIAVHPPLYYLLGSFFCKDDGKLLEEEIFVNDGTGFINIVHPKEEREFPYSGKARSAHLLRLFSLALSALNIYVIYLLVLRIFPGKTILASSTALFVATIPQFLHISASISNENMSSALSTLYLFVLLYYLKGQVRAIHHIITGVLLGCCLLSKVTAMFYLPLTLCVIIFSCLRDTRRLIASSFVVFCTAALVAGWWYLRHWLVSNDPSMITYIRVNPFSLSYVRMMMVQTFVSFFGYFGAMQFSIQGLHLFLYGIVMLLGTAGICCLLVKGKMTTFQGKALGLLFLSFLGGLGSFISFNISFVGASMGRYLFIVIAPIAIITFAGLQSLFPPRWKNPVLIALSFLLIFLNLDMFFRVLKPAYAETLLVEEVAQPLFSYPASEINETTTVGQTFISLRNRLCAIRVMFSCGSNQKSGEITFSLREKGYKGKVLRQINFPLKKINLDGTRYFFFFPPLENSMEKEYEFYFSSPSLSPGSGVSLWCELSDCYHGGGMRVNGEPTDGDLYFTVYYFTGEEPKTDWQGKREVVINQGQYVGVRERQLYQERSKEFRVGTKTHKKMKRLEEAFNNKYYPTKHRK